MAVAFQAAGALAATATLPQLDLVAPTLAADDIMIAAINAKACSATVNVVACGVFSTRTPRFCAASSSTLSKPTPARTINFKFVAAAINAASALVPLQPRLSAWCLSARHLRFRRQAVRSY